MRNRAPSIAVLVMTGLILAASGPVAAYLKLGSRVQSRTVTLKLVGATNRPALVLAPISKGEWQWLIH